MTKRVAHIGKFWGEYRITDELQTSTASRIFLAESHILPQHIVAIKSLPNIHLDAHQEESFLQETRFLQRLQHPHILSLITAGIDKGAPYTVSEYAENGSLDKTMQHQVRLPWDVDQALSIILQIGQALQYAHQQNILHCNLKPQNILFNAQGEALLADFSLVSLPESLQATAVATYMAPEQILGTISKQCDQYSLGCIAYEMFTSHTPYHAQSLQYGGRQRLPRLIPPTHFNPALPQHIEQAILTALAPEPDLRHSDLQAFLAALGSVGMPVEAQISNIPTSIIATAQPFDDRDFVQDLAFSASPMAPTPNISFQRNNAYRPKSRFLFSRFLFSKGQKILVAISCLLVLVTLAGGFFAFAANQTKSRMQNTPTSAHNNIPTTINTSNAVATPTHTSVPSPASSSTPGTITYPVTLQPPPNVKSTPTAHPTPTPTPTAQIPTQNPNSSPSPTPPATSSSSTSTAALNITPTQLGNTNCARRTSNSYRCTVQLSLNTTGSGRQTWIAYSTGVTAPIIPFIGTITAGQTTQVTIIVFDTCKHPGAFVFTIGHAKVSTIVIWAC
jgi:serine/threonine protein kinase